MCVYMMCTLEVGTSAVRWIPRTLYAMLGGLYGTLLGYRCIGHISRSSGYAANAIVCQYHVHA